MSFSNSVLSSLVIEVGLDAGFAGLSEAGFAGGSGTLVFAVRLCPSPTLQLTSAYKTTNTACST